MYRVLYESKMEYADPILDHRRFHRAYRPFCTAWVVVLQVAFQIGFDQGYTVELGENRPRQRPWHPSQYHSERCWDNQRVRRGPKRKEEDFQQELWHYPRKLNQFQKHGESICPKGFDQMKLLKNKGPDHAANAWCEKTLTCPFK